MQIGDYNGTVALTDRVSSGQRVEVHHRSSHHSVSFAGYRFPPDVILLAVRWYLRYGLSYRDVEELLAERGIDVDHVTIYRWVQRFTPLLIDAARPCRRPVVRRRNICQGGRCVAVCVPGCGSARSSH